MFKVDAHVHTAESSACGKTPAEAMVRLYADAGYDAIAVTDHYCESFFARCPGLDWAAQADRLLRGYRVAAEAGLGAGLEVLLGVELTPAGQRNDYLIYGLTEEFIASNPRLHEVPLWEVRELCESVGALVAQAHPFRPGLTRAAAALVHGVEVVNGHPGHHADNPAALAWAREHGLLMVGGSDAHFEAGAARAGMVFERRIATGAELATAVREGEALEIFGPEGERVALGRAWPAGAAPEAAGA